MKNIQSLAVGMGLAIILPATTTWAVCEQADLHEAHYSGHAKHTSAAGVFAVSEVVTIYEKLNTTQVNPWYPWDQVTPKKYTLVISAEVDSSTNTLVSGTTFLREVWFINASFAFYEDTVTNAVYANVATFTDGAPILTGTISGMYAQGLVNAVVPEALGVTGLATITGGSGIDNALCTELLMNDFFAWLPATSPAGYKEAYDSKWECCITPTSTETSSWGRMKGLYR